MPAPKTLLAFPAQQSDPDLSIVVDDSDFEEPTTPYNPRPERDTNRPSADNLAALVDATRDPPAWLGEPRWAVDPESGRMVLAAPYRARQVDCHGNTFTVECPAGVDIDPPATAAQARAVRTALVAAAMRVVRHAWVSRGGSELMVPLDDDWRREITAAFRDGDAGVRARG